jgi:hypothetical protein
MGFQKLGYLYNFTLLVARIDFDRTGKHTFLYLSECFEPSLLDINSCMIGGGSTGLRSTTRYKIERKGGVEKTC